MSGRLPGLIGVMLLCGCGGSVPATVDTDGTTTGSAGSSSVGGSDGGSSSTASTGDVEQDPPTHTPGSRLQPVMHRSSSGDERLAHWFDSELGFDCAFRETEEGFACAPLGRLSVTYFADAECSQRAAPSVECPPATYVYESSTACSPGNVFRQDGSSSSTLFRRYPDGECAPSPIEGVPLEPVPRSELVGAQRTLQADDDLLGHWVFEASDGTMQWDGPVDLASGRRCEPSEGLCPIADVVAHETPYIHRNASCSTNDVAWWSDDETCAEPLFARTTTGELQALDAPLTGQQVWLAGPDDACEPGPEDYGDNTYRMRELVADDAPAVNNEDIASGRLRLLQPRTTSGSLAGPPSATWHDAQLGIDCTFRRDSAGNELCTPDRPFSPRHYRDSECATPIMRNPYGYAVGWFTLDRNSDACDSEIIGLVEVTADYVGPVFEVVEDECVQVVNPGDLRPFVQLEVHDLDDIAALEEVRL